MLHSNDKRRARKTQFRQQSIDGVCQPGRRVDARGGKGGRRFPVVGSKPGFFGVDFEQSGVRGFETLQFGAQCLGVLH